LNRILICSSREPAIRNQSIAENGSVGEPYVKAG
jgi:hypothetical protein